LRTTRIIKVVRLVKLVRVAKMRDVMRDFAASIKSNLAYLLLRIVSLTALLCLVTHLISCLWYVVGESAPDGWTSYDSKIRGDLMDGEGASSSPREGVAYTVGGDFGFWYMASARWVVSQLNGRTDMDERRNMRERCFTVIIGVLLSVVGQATFIALITRSMIDLSNLFKAQNARRRMLNEYLCRYVISTGVDRSVKKYVREYKDAAAEAEVELTVLACLPRQLQAELIVEVRKPFLTQHPLFSTFANVFDKTHRELCTKVVRPVYAVRDEIVFEEDDICSRMLQLEEGQLSYGSSEALDSKAENDAKMANENEAFCNFDVGGIAGKSSSSFGPSFTRDFSISSEKSRVNEVESFGQLVENGQFVSEAALWVSWSNQGTLLAEGNCRLLEVQSEVLAEMLKTHRSVLTLTVAYARRFRQALADEEILSDILSFDNGLSIRKQLEDVARKLFRRDNGRQNAQTGASGSMMDDRSSQRTSSS
jgi:hypothetical protein